MRVRVCVSSTRCACPSVYGLLYAFEGFITLRFLSLYVCPASAPLSTYDAVLAVVTDAASYPLGGVLSLSFYNPLPSARALVVVGSPAAAGSAPAVPATLVQTLPAVPGATTLQVWWDAADCVEPVYALRTRASLLPLHSLATLPACVVGPINVVLCMFVCATVGPINVGP